MKCKIVAIFNRSVTIETDDEHPYDCGKVYEILLNQKTVKKSSKNVVSIAGLRPDTDYELQWRVDGKLSEIIYFRTKYESVFLNVKEFGAVGDGIQEDTAAIQAAIFNCPKDGTVYLPEGRYYVTPIFLKSHMTLSFHENAVLLGHIDRRRYPILPGMLRTSDESGEYNVASWEGNPLSTFASLITAIDCEEIDLIGPGTIDGNANQSDWWQDPKKKRIAWRPNTVFFCRCRKVRMQNLTVQNSPSWTIHPYYSDQLMFLNLNIKNPADSPNTDGFDPESCEDVKLLGSTISVGDDCIAIKSGKYYMGRFHYKRANRLLVQNCLLERGHGSITIGSEIASGVSNVFVNQCIFRGTDRGVRIKTRRGRGNRSIVANIFVENVEMKGVHMPLTVNMFYFCDPDGHSEYVQNQAWTDVTEKTPEIHNIKLQKIRCTGVDNSFICAYGLPEMPIESLQLEDVSVQFLPREKWTSTCPIMMDHFPEMSGKGIYIRNMKELSMKRVCIVGSKDLEPEFQNVGKIELEDLEWRQEEVVEDGIKNGCIA